MSPPLKVALLTFPDCQVLDVAGPAMVFAAGNDAVGKPHYEILILSADGGTVQTASAMAIVTRSIREVAPSSIDTLLIAGGHDDGPETLVADAAVRTWAIDAARSARRYGSICNGTLALAHLGLLRGQRVTTHWATCAVLAQKYPDVEVDTSALFVNDGRLWTSAGVTTGIDMSLEMVACDLGKTMANAIAKRLVLYARRPGYQSQFSPVLNAQSHADAPFATLIEWMRENLSAPLDVSRLAAKAAMSERTFLRRFAQSVGETPARFVETLRLDQARHLLAAQMSVKDIAARTGYSSADRLSKAFDRRHGMTITQFRDLHCSPEARPADAPADAPTSSKALP